MTALWVEITETRGSAPRDAGTAMKVTSVDTQGTIGGGALEYAAIAKARQMLSAGDTEYVEVVPLGPNLGQCCGGSVTLRYTNQMRQTDRGPLLGYVIPTHTQHPVLLWIWGAGHVGRAVIKTLPPRRAKVSWIDSSLDRFPEGIGRNAKIIPAADMPLLAKRAPKNVHHLIFTYSHDIDLALCAALLKRGFASCGLIGSDTKWARFQKRLREAGLDPAPITCPIGDKSLGKAPHQIAQGVVAELMPHPKTKATA